MILWTLLLGCGEKTDCVDGRCATDDGTYSIVVPEGEGPFPVVFHLHGWNGTGAEMAEASSGLQAEADARGALLVFPDGVDGAWNHNQWADQRDDIAFLRGVIDDVDSMHGVERHRVFAGGHSLGGTMVWTGACEAPEGFAAFHASSGGPFRPLQDACTGRAVSLMHSHGLADPRVALDERTYDAIGYLADEGGCGPAVQEEDGPLSCTTYAGCRDGHEVRLCTHGGKHKDAPGWEARMLDFYGL